MEFLIINKRVHFVLLVLMANFIVSSFSLKFIRDTPASINKVPRVPSAFYSSSSSSSPSSSISKTKCYGSKVGLAVDNDMEKTLFMMFIISAPLGMMLDNHHGLFNVLSYADNGLRLTVENNHHVYLRTALWVPALFGVAGVVMSYIILKLDQLFSITSSDNRSAPPSWSHIFYGISFFSGQYYLSGLLDYSLSTVDGPQTIHITLAASTMAGILLFDRSAAGVWLAALTVVAGPLAEIFIINVFHAYQYTHADWFGVCSWIFWIYATGAPAVGKLARRIHFDNETDTVRVSNSQDERI